MSLWRGLSSRLLLLTLLFSVIGAVGITIWSTHNAFRQTVSRVLHPESGPARQLRAICRADPARFVKRRHDGAFTFAFDIDTGRSANPDAPRPPDGLLDDLRAGDPMPVQLTEIGKGMFALRGDPSGPCSAFVHEWAQAGSVAAGAMGRTVLVTLALLVVAMMLAGLFAMRPFVRRVAHLAGRASRIGAADFEPGAERVGDALTAVGDVIDRAHERIVADRAALLDQQRALERHLADVAHDIRTPLASAQLAIESVIAGTAEPTAPRRAMEDLVYLATLVENLRLISRLEDAAELPVRGPCDWTVIVDRVVSRFSALGALREISVFGARPDGAVWAAGDAAMAEQLLANLVHNAVVYGHPGGHVAVRLETHGDRFTLEVLDDGPGVDAELLPRLGERALRADAARERAPDGTGLGLAIVRAVCARWSWAVRFAPNTPTGLRVSIDGEATAPPI